MRKEAKLLLSRAMQSVVLAVDHFNRVRSDGRSEATLIFLDRAFELLLKAIIVHRGGNIREKDRAITIGFDACVRKCLSDASCKCLSDEDAITLQTVNALRDAAQHYIIEVEEEQLYIYCQAAITLLRRLLLDELATTIENHIPERVLLLSAKPPRNLPDVIASEYLRIKEMLAPGARRQIEAKSRLRALSVLESALSGRKAQPTERDLDRLAKAVASNEDWTSVFPGAATLTIDPSLDGKGISLSVVKRGGEEITLVPESAGSSVVAVKRVNELDHYSLYAKNILEKIKLKFPDLNTTKLREIISQLRLKEDTAYFKCISVGSQKHQRYSPAALDKIVKAPEAESVSAFWDRRKQA